MNSGQCNIIYYCHLTEIVGRSPSFTLKRVIILKSIKAKIGKNNQDAGVAILEVGLLCYRETFIN